MFSKHGSHMRLAGEAAFRGNVDKTVSCFHDAILSLFQPQIQNELVGCQSCGRAEHPKEVGTAVSAFLR